MNFELVLDANFDLPETPIWDDRTQRLYWTELFSGDVHEFDPKSGQDLCYVLSAGIIGAAIPCKNDTNKLLCAVEKGLCLFDKRTGDLSVVAQPNKNPSNCYCDTRVDAAGRIVTSTTSKLYGLPGHTPDMTGELYTVEKDGEIRMIKEGILQYNCMVWNTDNTKMYIADSDASTLIAYDYNLACGPVGDGKVVLNFNKNGLGMPDGISTDMQGNLYICHWTGQISVWDPGLSLLRTLTVPVEQVACCGFGGADMRDLFVATGRFGYTPEQMADRRGAGGIFRVRLDIPGVPYYFYND